MSTPTDSPSAAADRDPVQEARDHLEQALAEAREIWQRLHGPESGGG